VSDIRRRAAATAHPLQFEREASGAPRSRRWASLKSEKRPERPAHPVADRVVALAPAAGRRSPGAREAVAEALAAALLSEIQGFSASSDDSPRGINRAGEAEREGDG